MTIIVGQHFLKHYFDILDNHYSKINAIDLFFKRFKSYLVNKGTIDNPIWIGRIIKKKGVGRIIKKKMVAISTHKSFNTME